MRMRDYFPVKLKRIEFMLVYFQYIFSHRIGENIHVLSFRIDEYTISLDFKVLDRLDGCVLPARMNRIFTMADRQEKDK